MHFSHLTHVSDLRNGNMFGIFKGFYLRHSEQAFIVVTHGSNLLMWKTGSQELTESPRSFINPDMESRSLSQRRVPALTRASQCLGAIQTHLSHGAMGHVGNVGPRNLHFHMYSHSRLLLSHWGCNLRCSADT